MNFAGLDRSALGQLERLPGLDAPLFTEDDAG